MERAAAGWLQRRSRGPVAGLGPSVPTGKPTNADFPSAASTPPVSIMSPEPPLPRSPPAAANASTPAATRAPRPPQRSRFRRNARLSHPRLCKSHPRHAHRRPRTIDPCRRFSLWSEHDLFGKPASTLRNAALRARIMRIVSKDHAASPDQACRGLRVRQRAEGLGRRTHEDGQEEGSTAASRPHHPDDAEAGRRTSSPAVRSTG